MNLIYRILLCAVVFIVTLVLEVAAIFVFTPLGSVTEKQLDEFLLISAMWAFPLLLEFVLLLLAAAAMFTVAFSAALIAWGLTSPRTQAASVGRKVS